MSTRKIIEIKTPSGQGFCESGLFCHVDIIEVDENGKALADEDCKPADPSNPSSCGLPYFNVLRTRVMSNQRGPDGYHYNDELPIHSRYRSYLAHLFEVTFIIDNKHFRMLYDPCNAFLEREVEVFDDHDSSRDDIVLVDNQPNFTHTDECSSNAVHCFVSWDFNAQEMKGIYDDMFERHLR